MLPPPDSGPTTWVIPRIPEGQAEQARSLAAVYDQVAETAQSTLNSTQAARMSIGDPTWGAAAAAFDQLLDRLNRDTALLVEAAENTATSLRKYAAEVEAASHRHRFSLHRLAMAGAAIAVGGALIVATAGAGAVIVAATADAAAAATAAAAAALEAGESAVVELSTLQRLFAAIHGLVPIAFGAVARFEFSETYSAALNASTTGHYGFDFSRDHLIAVALSSLAGGGAGMLASKAVTAAPLAIRIGVPALASGVSGAAASDGYTWTRTGKTDAWSWVRDSGTGSVGGAIGHKEFPLQFRLPKRILPAMH